ncbi:unnamed protein product [marine sediment metagenome]|uniref:Uncharacterized protein n=1 Tax=marine sediment metagenome TaxID=412755 RepID=X0XWZ6_9ZZZZ
MRSKNKGPAYKGHDSNIHVTVTSQQRAKVLDLAKREGLSISEFMRRTIDGMEVAK